MVITFFLSVYVVYVLRACGGVCCAQCSKHRAVLSTVDAEKPVRVCDKCLKEQRQAAEVKAKAAANSEGTNASNGYANGTVKRGTLRPTGISAMLAASSPSSHMRSSSTTFANGSVDINNISESLAAVSGSSPSPPSSIPNDSISNQSLSVPPYRRALFSLTRAYRGDDRLLNVMELYLSEITYCKELEVLIGDFVTPLLKQITTGKKGLLSNQNQTQLLGKNVSPNLLIFLNAFQPIYTLALELHKCLHAKIITGEDPSSTSPTQATPQKPTGWNPNTTTFGELFLRYAHLFDLYVEYSQTHKQALAILTDPDEIFYKEIFLKYDSIIKERMDEIHQDQRQMSEAAKFLEKEWIQSADIIQPSNNSQSANSATPLETVFIEPVSPPLSPRSNRFSVGARLSIAAQPVIMDEPPTHTSLHDLLTSPFMRVSKYVWLLSSLLRSTPIDHPDNLTVGPESSQRLLGTALKAVQQSLNNINTAILVGDNLNILNKLQDKFTGSPKEIDLVAPNRTLIKEGQLMRQTRKGVNNYYL